MINIICANGAQWAFGMILRVILNGHDAAITTHYFSIEIFRIGQVGCVVAHHDDDENLPIYSP